jgi:hypothetical protein
LKCDESVTPKVQVGIPQASAEFEMVAPTARNDQGNKNTESEYYEVRAQEVQLHTNNSFHKTESALAK